MNFHLLLITMDKRNVQINNVITIDNIEFEP